eukprot:4482960-Amphidinium_carterae.1
MEVQKWTTTDRSPSLEPKRSRKITGQGEGKLPCVHVIKPKLAESAKGSHVKLTANCRDPQVTLA